MDAKRSRYMSIEKPAAIFYKQLMANGYVLLKSPYFDGRVVIIINNAAKERVPREYSYSCPMFTVKECIGFMGASGEELRTLCAVRAVFRDSMIIKEEHK